jgi:N-acetylmuramoyl-L-alanine amidase
MSATSRPLAAPFRFTAPQSRRHYGRVSFVFALLACWFVGAPGWAASVERVEVQHDRIVVRFDQPIADASSFVLAAPHRIALDLQGATPGGKIAAGGPVSSVARASCSTLHARPSSPKACSAATDAN